MEDIAPITENHLKKSMDNYMETVVCEDILD